MSLPRGKVLSLASVQLCAGKGPGVSLLSTQPKLQHSGFGPGTAKVPCLYSGVFSSRLMLQGKVLESPSSGVFKLHYTT